MSLFTRWLACCTVGLEHSCAVDPATHHGRYWLDLVRVLCVLHPLASLLCRLCRLCRLLVCHPRLNIYLPAQTNAQTTRTNAVHVEASLCVRGWGGCVGGCLVHARSRVSLWRRRPYPTRAGLIHLRDTGNWPICNYSFNQYMRLCMVNAKLASCCVHPSGAIVLPREDTDIQAQPKA